jgi:RNA polymerase sigma-70 factor (ECF subfamily)
VDELAARREATSPEPGDQLRPLLLDVGRGSASSFEALYDAIAGSVFGIALRVLRDPHLAEDVAQEALLEVWRMAPRYRPDAGSARAWILTIAHRRAVDRVRTEQALKARDQREAAPASGGYEIDEAVDVMYAQWEAARVRAAFAAVTPLQRQALELAFYRGLTHREVALELGVPLGTAKARLRDGLIRLRDELGGER